MGIPSELYRNAIDLNRYSNQVSRQIVVEYNNIIVQAVNNLKIIGGQSETYKAARLRSILAQLKESLDTWAERNSILASKELQGLAELQSEFVVEQLRKVLPKGAQSMVNTVEIGPTFGRNVVNIDPTEINVVVLEDDLFEAAYGSRQTFNLASSEGVPITLPNGRTLRKSFRGIAENQSDMFGQLVRTGLLTGESTQSIARRMIGRLEFDFIGTPAQIKAAGGELTAVADHQILTLVRTSVNQVANKASMAVYESNQDVSSKYQWVATLDTRTSAICAALDDRIFEYGKGPMPPQHFNCRSTIVGIIDYDGLRAQGFDFDPPEDGERATKRDPKTGLAGQVPADMSYGEWLYQQPKFIQEEVLGVGRTAYFDRLAKDDPVGQKGKNAIAKFVSKDGSEITLEQLRARYGSP